MKKNEEDVLKETITGEYYMKSLQKKKNMPIL